MTPKKIYVPENSIKCLCHYDKSALALVTNSHKTGSVEYTDLSQVWHDISEEPKVGEHLIGEDTNGLFSLYRWGRQASSWSMFVKIYALRRWAYTEELLPKGGEQ